MSNEACRRERSGKRQETKAVRLGGFAALMKGEAQ